jgi:hypothetical protein
VPQALTSMRRWLQQELLYCCCLRFLLFLLRPVRAAITVAADGECPSGIHFRGNLEGSVGCCEAAFARSLVVSRL